MTTQGGGRFWAWAGGFAFAGALAAWGAWAYSTRGEAGQPTLASGRALYLAYGCAACHGLAGDGKGMTGAHFDPPPTDFHDPASYRFGRDRESVRVAIHDGVLEASSRMPAFDSLSDPEVDALADYVLSLQNEGEAPPDGSLSVVDPWIRAVPPSSSVSAAYMILENGTGVAAYLVSARTAAASSTELHRMGLSGGMMTMGEVAEAAVPAHGRLALAPGGYHLMLIGLKKPLRVGDTVPLVLRFKGGKSLKVSAPVRKNAPGGDKS